MLIELTYADGETVDVNTDNIEFMRSLSDGKPGTSISFHSGFVIVKETRKEIKEFAAAFKRKYTFAGPSTKELP